MKFAWVAAVPAASANVSAKTRRVARERLRPRGSDMAGVSSLWCQAARCWWKRDERTDGFYSGGRISTTDPERSFLFLLRASTNIFRIREIKGFHHGRFPLRILFIKTILYCNLSRARQIHMRCGCKVTGLISGYEYILYPHQCSPIPNFWS